MAETTETVQDTGYPLSEKKQAVINRVFTRFKRMQEERDKVRREFDDLSLEQYVNNSVDAYNGIESDSLKATKEDWQSLIWDHKTRGKVKTTIAMIVGMRPYLSVTGKTAKAHDYAQDMFEVYEDSWKNENGAYKLYLQALSACIKGTVIVEESYVEEKVKRKKIISVNQETGKVKSREEEVIKDGYGCVKANIVSLLNFYPNENHPDIEEDCSTLFLYTEEKFQAKFGKYPDAKFVRPGVFMSGESYKNSLYQSVSDKKDTLIEVMRYYNENTDEFVILANGFWINYQENDEVSPIPFKHKKLPFAKTVFELADEECFYGKSLPDLMHGEQGSTNALERLMLDQEILKGNRPILLGMGIDIDSFQLYPGKPMKLTGSVNEVQEMDMQGASQSGFEFLRMLKANSNENTSIDPTAQGVHSGRKTARETVILDENSKRNSGPFQLHIYKLLFDRARLRVENIKQFYTKPVQYAVLKDKYGKAKVDGQGKKRTEPEYRTVTVAKPGKAPQWISVKPELEGYEFELRFVEDFEVTDNRSYRIEMAKALLDEAKTNPLISADEATIDYLEAIRKSPDRFYIKPKPEDIKFQNKMGVPPENAQQPV